MASYVQYNATMATASMTMASHSMDLNSTVMSASVDPHIMESTREVLIDSLKSTLYRYARSNDRRMTLRTLKDAKFLMYVPMESAADRSGELVSDLERDVSHETVLLNDVMLKPKNSPEAEKGLVNHGSNSGCVETIKAFSQVLCENTTLDESNLYQQVLGRVCRKSLSAEVYYHLNSMMGSDALFVQDFGEVTRKKNAEGPTNLKLYNTGGEVQMILDRTIQFGLFREKDIVINRPWIKMNCSVRERTNFSTNATFRTLKIETPGLY
mmetsp:Transcript_18952/g.52888  ORF Transcript_18952/g.52888 Transcript_18952/m.52888 type:complete len:268 (-) Transcript_18952:189-992(-)